MSKIGQIGKNGDHTQKKHFSVILEGNNGFKKRFKFELETQSIHKLFEPRMVQFIFQTRYSDNGLLLVLIELQNRPFRLYNYPGQTV